MPQQAPCGIFIFVQTQARAALKHQCLSERRIKPPAGTLQAEGKGAGFKNSPISPGGQLCSWTLGAVGTGRRDQERR